MEGCIEKSGAQVWWWLVWCMNTTPYKVPGLGNTMWRWYDLCIGSDIGLSKSNSRTPLLKRNVMYYYACRQLRLAFTLLPHTNNLR